MIPKCIHASTLQPPFAWTAFSHLCGRAYGVWRNDKSNSHLHKNLAHMKKLHILRRGMPQDRVSSLCRTSRYTGQRINFVVISTMQTIDYLQCKQMMDVLVLYNIHKMHYVCAFPTPAYPPLTYTHQHKQNEYDYIIK